MSFKKLLNIIVYFFLSVLGFLISMVFIAYIFLNFSHNDISVDFIDDSILHFNEKIEVPAEQENMFYDILLLNQEIDIPVPFNHLNVLVKNNHKELESYYKKNKEAFEIFNHLSKKEIYQNPYLVDVESELDDSYSVVKYNNLSSFFVLLRIKAVELAKEGENEQALKDLINIIKVGEKISNSRNSLNEKHYGTFIYREGIKGLQEIFQFIDIGEDELSYVQEELDAHRFVFNNEDYIKTEYLEYKYYILNLEEYSKIPKFIFKNDFYFKKNETLKNLSEEFKKILENGEKSCLEREEFDNHQVDITEKSFLELFFTENVAGIINYPYNESFLLTNFQTRECVLKTDYNLINLYIALQKYKKDNNNYPDSLEELFPKYIKFNEVQADPFNEKKIQYKKDERIIYSVGDNEKDEDGGGDDIVIKL